MKRIAIVLLIFLTVYISCNGQNNAKVQLIDITRINKNIVLDIKYASKDNFLKEAVYPEARCFLVPEAALKLDSIQTDLEKMGLGLKIFDGYRPFSVTEKMWEILPDNRYVANPKNGSRHNRGAAVDLTLIDSTGQELQMPTAFDDFTEKAAHAYRDLPEDIIKNRALLKNIMEKYGFSAIKSEWWHYDLKNYKQYPILDLSFEEIDKISNLNNQ
jgi:D-alanyl-D-alanine dipeptidase